MKKKTAVGAVLLILCLFGAWKLGWFSRGSATTSRKPSSNQQDYQQTQTKLEKLDSSNKQAKNNAATKKEIEAARKNAKEKEGTFKKVAKGNYYMMEVMENDRKHDYILDEALDPTHFIFKDGDPILYTKGYVKSLNSDVIFSISSKR